MYKTKDINKIEDKIEDFSTEDKILREAELEFLEKGFSGARTTSIAERAGVTHAMLHYYFRTKERLFSKVLSEKLSELAKTFSLRIDEETSLDKCLREAIEIHFEFVKANPMVPRFMVAEVFSNDKLMDLIKDQLAEIANDTVERLQRKINLESEAGNCRRVNAHILLVDIISLNVFPFLGLPMLKKMGVPIVAESIDLFLNSRKEENVKTIFAKLGIKPNNSSTNI